MTPGGTDYLFRLGFGCGDRALAGAVAVLTAQWPQAIFQDAQTGWVYDRFDLVPFGRIDELLVYKSQEAWQSWTVNGMVPENEHDCVHLLVRPNELTVVL